MIISAGYKHIADATNAVIANHTEPTLADLFPPLPSPRGGADDSSQAVSKLPPLWIIYSYNFCSYYLSSYPIFPILVWESEEDSRVRRLQSSHDDAWIPRKDWSFYSRFEGL